MATDAEPSEAWAPVQSEAQALSHQPIQYQLVRAAEYRGHSTTASGG
ncbi:hypothetical protein WME75_32255 [Sorangium sp. So ce1014]|jgi:hypothetical protein